MAKNNQDQVTATTTRNCEGPDCDKEAMPDSHFCGPKCREATRKEAAETPHGWEGGVPCAQVD